MSDFITLLKQAISSDVSPVLTKTETKKLKALLGLGSSTLWDYPTTLPSLASDTILYGVNTPAGTPSPGKFSIPVMANALQTYYNTNGFIAGGITFNSGTIGSVGSPGDITIQPTGNGSISLTLSDLSTGNITLGNTGSGTIDLATANGSINILYDGAGKFINLGNVSNGVLQCDASNLSGINPVDLSYFTGITSNIQTQLTTAGAQSPPQDFELSDESGSSLDLIVSFANSQTIGYLNIFNISVDYPNVDVDVNLAQLGPIPNLDIINNATLVFSAFVTLGTGVVVNTVTTTNSSNGALFIINPATGQPYSNADLSQAALQIWGVFYTASLPTLKKRVIKNELKQPKH